MCKKENNDVACLQVSMYLLGPREKCTAKEFAALHVGVAVAKERVVAKI